MSDQQHESKGTEAVKDIAKPKEKKANKDTDRTENANQKEEDILLESLLNDYNAASSGSSKCPVPSCKQRLTATSFKCQHCNMDYCIKHRLPESHSPKCVDKAKRAAHSAFQGESSILFTAERQNRGVTNSTKFSIAKTKEDIKKRYKEKLEQTKQERVAGKKKGKK
ncbi:1667_t:CDS:2 [Paraglomus occultum]|uniref:1667_t:CDS:1 n=1 Tax=Paraglomus occultum TaxID=144539 RepID=A0A9N8W0E9_9GLOM|nr:1667_t:CDS:2 [Paraglomus occultum]